MDWRIVDRTERARAHGRGHEVFLPLGRVGLLRGYGNAIVPQVAAEFIRAAADLNEWNAATLARAAQGVDPATE